MFYLNRIDFWMKWNYENCVFLFDNDVKDIKKKFFFVLLDNYCFCGLFVLKDLEFIIIFDFCIY